ncbi:hypothetical protein BIY28_22090 [Brenneria goodwinii]|nr:hypothetical protein BIY28_22090 [Brenneria goodwinii]
MVSVINSNSSFIIDHSRLIFFSLKKTRRIESQSAPLFNMDNPHLFILSPFHTLVNSRIVLFI